MEPAVGFLRMRLWVSGQVLLLKCMETRDMLRFPM